MPSRHFHFPFEALLKSRRLAEQEHQRAVARIERERLELEEHLRRRQDEIAAGKQSLRSGLVGAINMPALRLQAAASIDLMRRAQRVVLELAGIHRRLEAARALLVEATRRRRAIELLRERRFEQWKAELERVETATLDELAVMAAARHGLRSLHAAGPAHSTEASP